MACSHSFGIHGDNLLVNVRNILLTLFDNLWFKGGLSILWYFDFHRTIPTVYLLAFIAVSIIVVVRTLGFFVPKMILHFCFHHFLDGAAKKIFKSILDIFSSLNIVFFEKLTNDISFSFCHFNSVNRFLLFCHNKRPSYELDFIIEEPLMTYLQKKFHIALFKAEDDLPSDIIAG